ncbi:MAG: hemagglutinin repeat-containing protein, partial [Burkholderiaceae bacterium]
SVAIDVRQASNLGGLITSAAQTALRTQALDNTGGELSGGTLLDIDTHGQTLTSANGKLLANGDITVASGTLDNTGGAITGTGNVALRSNVGVVNRQGQLAANGAVDLAATTLDNTDGAIDADRVAVRLGAGALDNTRGKVIGASALTLQPGAIRNAAGIIATGASLALDTQGQALDNGNGGQIVAQGDLAITAGALGNDHGAIASLDGALHIDTGTQAIDNTAGRLQAAGDTGVAAGDVGNRAGVVSGRDITLATGALDNGNGGQLLAARNLSARTQALANDGGLIQAVADVDVDTQDQTLTNTHSGDAGGILAGGKLDIHAGTLDNRAGFVASAGDQTLSAGLIDNRALDGQAARIVSNTGSTVAGTLVKNGGSTIEATDLHVNAATLDNAGGTLRAAGDAAFTAAALDNTNGTLSAQHALAADAAALTNAGGSIVGDAGVTVTTDSHSLDGRIASANDVTLNINGDYANTGLLSAQKNLTVNAANLDNSGTLTAGATLTANTGNLTNSGEISATTTNLNVAGTLTNTASGLIDGTVTSIRAGTTDNAGRIYGDWLTIGGGTIDNHDSGTIAARNTLVLGAQHIRNTGGALLYSLGDMAIGGALDAAGNPVGQAQELLNGSSRIEAGGNMAIAAADLTNRNDGLRTHVAETVEPINKTYIQPRDSVDKYDPAVLGWQPEYREVGRYVLPSTVYPIDRFGAVEKTPAIVVYCDLYGDSATGLCTGSYTYTATDPVWALFGVTPPNDDGLTVPVMPPQGPSNPTGACSYEFGGDTPGVARDTQGACGTYWTAFDSYSQTLAERVQAANSELDGKIAAFNADVDARGFERWQEYRIDSRRTDETVIDASAPATIAAGGTLSITGDVGKRNENSVIVAGGAIDIAGAAVQNINEDGVRTTTEIGEVRKRDTKYHGFHGDYSVEFSGWSPTTGAPVVGTFPLPTVTFQAYAGDPTASRDLKVTVATPDAAAADTGLIRITDGNRLPAMSGIQTKLPAASATVPTPAGGAQIVTAPIALALPANSLFQIHPEPAARTLIETDPRFTDQRTFLSSDYLLQALNRDPERQLKRYGDGFYEQRLVNDQILALTGQRYLSDYRSTEAEYQALMDAGVAFARRYQLAPGVALSAEQMALLTTDIVWLTTQTVTLADGSTQQVLVPQVYLRRPQSGDLQPGGALIAGRDVTIHSDSDLVNSGTIAGQRSTTLVAEHDLVNDGGRISGQAILARAGNDLKNLSGVIQGSGADSSVALLAGRDILLQTRTLDSSSAASATTAASTRTSLDRIATVQGGNVRLDAVRDLVARGATVHADSDLVATAGRDIATQSVAARYTLAVQTGGNTQGRTGYVQEDHVTQTASTLGAGRDLALVAGGDVALHGTNVDAGGNALLQGANVTIDAAKDRHWVDVQVVRPDAYDRTMRDDETLAGGNVSAGNALTVVATGSADANPADGNIAINGAYLTSQTGAVSLIAKNDIAIGSVATQHDVIDERYNKTHGFASSTTTTQSHSTQSTQQQGSTISGDSLLVQAGDAGSHSGDLTINGSSLVADHDVALSAGRNLTITTARNTEQSQSSFEQKTSGLFTSGAAITLGKKQQNDDSQSQSTTNVGSTVASLHGNINATAGADYHQTGSQVLTPAGDIDIAGRNVVIDTAVDTGDNSEQHAFRQSGLTLAVSNPLVTAAQTAQQMSSAAGQTKDARMQALAGATAALAAKTAADQIAADPEHAGGINVSVSLGSAHSQSQSTQTQSSNIGSTVAAGGNVHIQAKSDTPGDNQQGNLTVTGGEIAAGRDATLDADGKITLQAAEDTASEHSSNSSSSASLGVGFGIGKEKMGWSVSASASNARGNADGNDVTQQNTHVSAGNTLTLKSGSDTTLDGAVASGNQVKADIGANLNIASRQDTSTYDSQQHSLGGSLSIGAGISGSVNAGRSKINSDYASVTEQSGIRAGDGGFDVQVKGDTTLTGGAITSTQAAIDQGNNRFHTGGQLALADIDNHAAYDANAAGVNLGAGVSLDGKLAPAGSGAGIGRDSGNANSTTQAAISGIAGNQAA